MTDRFELLKQRLLTEIVPLIQAGTSPDFIRNMVALAIQHTESESPVAHARRFVRLGKFAIDPQEVSGTYALESRTVICMRSSDSYEVPLTERAVLQLLEITVNGEELEG